MIPETEFLRFYETHRALLERAILSYAYRDRELAKDALQHGLAASLEKFRDREFNDAFAGEFLRYTITCAEHYIDKERKKRGREPNADAKSYDEPEADHDPDRNMLLADLERSMGTLTADERRTIQFYELAEPRPTQEEAAALCGVSLSTFKRLRDKAMKKLRVAMGASETIA